jgi:2,3-bisphosphoglycerate-independent phosphoglycerate mutase
MPTGPAARANIDTTAHGLPPVLTPGPGCLTVIIGFMPAWRGVPLAAVAALQAAKTQRTADIYVEMLQIKLAEIGIGRIATLCGRHYAMDMSQHWDRTVRAFTMLVHSEGEPAIDPVDGIHSSFLRGISDEFIQPIIIEDPIGTPVRAIRDGDVVVFFNHRADGMKQLVRALAVPDPGTGGFGKPNVTAICLTEYDSDFDLPSVFKPAGERQGLARIFAENGVYNCRVTEAEKFVHVTQFFNGGGEGKHPCEQRVTIPSKPGMEHEAPEMGAFKVTDSLLRGLEAGENEVFIVNLAAADLVAHTGSLEKTVEAVQFVDTCLGGILRKMREVGGTAIITADHGNIEQMRNPRTGAPDNGHTANPVPFHLIAGDLNGTRLREDGALEDIAPTILAILGIEKPAEMTGRDLRIG